MTIATKDPLVAEETPQLIDDLRALFSRAKIPSSPALAAKILSLADDSDSTVDQFAQLIEMDPALSARLLKMTNSAQCAQRSKVTTVKRAVTLLGVNRVRTVSLGFQLLGHIDRLGGCPFDMKTFWKQSVLRGCIAREIAEEVVPGCSDEAFLVGLLQDAGILLLVQVLGEDYTDLYQSGRLSPASFYKAENERFPYNHVDAISMMAAEWRLPELIVRPLVHHDPITVDDTSDDLDLLCGVSFLAGSLILRDNDIAGAEDTDLADYAKDMLGLDEERLAESIARAGRGYVEIAGLLGGLVPEDMDVTELLGQANSQLMNTVEQERTESALQSEQLRASLGEYRERASRDPLTDVLNRGGLAEAARSALSAARQDGKPITVCFMDIDNFKMLNDHFGHHTGDVVLKGIARTLRNQLPNNGVIGRYGGEEFVVVVAGLSQSDAADFVEQTLQAVRQTKFNDLQLLQSVTCSLGLAWASADVSLTIEELIATADQQMYEAKRSGKDRCCSVSIGGGAESDAADRSSASTVIGEHPAPVEVSLDGLARAAKALNQIKPSGFIGSRKQDRKILETPAKLYTFSGATFELTCDEAYVRDINTGGLGFVACRGLCRGEPAEIVIKAKQPIHVAGIVAYCRPAELSIYDVGLQTFLHSSEPIISKDPISAIRNLDWVASALESIKGNHGAS